MNFLDWDLPEVPYNPAETNIVFDYKDSDQFHEYLRYEHSYLNERDYD